MKNLVKIVIINIIFLFLITYFLEFISYNLIYGNLDDYIRNFFSTDIKNQLILSAPDYNKNIELYKPHQRNDESILYDVIKRPVLFLGCSYTYGQGINIYQTFASQFQKYTKRKTNTVAYPGNAPDSILKAIMFLYDYGDLDKNRYEYVVYTWMYNHICRKEASMVNKFLNEKYYANRNNSLKDKIMYIFDKLYFFKYISLKLYIKKERNLYEYQKDCILSINKLIKEKIPDIKFIFLIYDDLTENGHDGIEKNMLNPEIWSCLEEHGIKVVSTKELVGDILYKPGYKLTYDTFQNPPHPNSKAWEIIVPAIVNKYNMY